ARAEAFILPRPLVCYWQRAMAKKTHPHKMVIFLKKNTKKFAFSVRKPIFFTYFPALWRVGGD
ncbi:MAG: hypothetical protein UDD86_05245, partial [Sodaliphilus sp.]|nr:hypothetical protein [Sodaliphilus sp.]